MYRSQSKRRQLIQRTLVYSFMTVSVVVIVAFLMLIILGFSFNKRDGKIEQGGLLQFASIPSGATVTLDGIEASAKTPSKANVEAKTHTVKMDKSGYRTWQKTISVEAGGIGWLSYARLIPTTVKTEEIHSFPKLAHSLAASDRKWIIAQEDAAINGLTLINIESDTPKINTSSLPSTLLSVAATDAPQNYDLVAWSDNDDHVLIKRTYDTTKTEWFSLDRSDPSKSINLTSSFGINISDVKYNAQDGHDAYVLSDGVVRKANLNDISLSGVLVDNVAEIGVYDHNTLTYVTNADAAQAGQIHAGYRKDSMDAAQAVFSYPAGTANVHVALGDYYGKTYTAVTNGMVMEVYSGTLPKKDTKADLNRISQAALPSAPARVTIGENGRFAISETADANLTYDIELDKSDLTTFTKPAVSVHNLQWLDEYLLASDRGGELRFYEFDGANQQDIMPVIEGQAVSLTGNEKYIYGFAQQKDGTVTLQRGKMTTE